MAKYEVLNKAVPCCRLIELGNTHVGVTILVVQTHTMIPHICKSSQFAPASSCSLSQALAHPKESSQNKTDGHQHAIRLLVTMTTRTPACIDLWTCKSGCLEQGLEQRNRVSVDCFIQFLHGIYFKDMQYLKHFVTIIYSSVLYVLLGNNHHDDPGFIMID